MEQTIVVKGNTVQEAIHKALNMMNASVTDVSIVILENGGTTFFGLRKKEAVVQVTKKDGPDVAMLNDRSPTTGEQTENGPKKASIHVEKGHIVVSSTAEDKPYLIPHPTSNIYVNGNLLISQKRVSEKDVIIVQMKETILPFSWVLSVAEDELTASLYVHPEQRTTNRLLDTLPHHRLNLKIESVTESKNLLSEREIRLELTERGIVSGILDSEIKKAVQTLEPNTFIIAKGVPAVEGADGKIDFSVEMNRSSQVQLKELADGKVDYRESSFIPTVEEGMLIAKITKAVPGTPGMTVKGEQRLPKPVKEIIVLIGKGVRMLDQETIISLMSGRPHVEKRGNRVKVSLLKHYEHEGDVDLKSGNMYFDGDIHITGNVDDTMKVEVKGDVVIDGSVSKAAVQSGHCVQVRGNVFSSTLSSGKSNMIVSELTNSLHEIVVHLGHVQKSLHFLLNEAKIRQLEVSQTWDIFRLITGKKNAPMMSEIKQFIQKTARYHSLIDEEWSGLSMHLYKLFFTLPPKNRNVVDYLNETVLKAQTLVETNQVMDEEDVQLIVPYALNSRLFSSGDVKINGPGLYNCFVKAGKTFVAEEGYVRGGEVYAARHIKVKSSSSETGVETILRTDETGIIEIDEAFAETVIIVGKRRHQFVRKEYRVKAKLTPDGYLIIR